MPRESFAIGDRVRVKNEFVSGHVRMPGYIRGKTGVVVGISPPYPFPDASAHNLQSQDEPTYDVAECRRPGDRSCRRFRELPGAGSVTADRNEKDPDHWHRRG
jgi:hypothetical protein